MQDEDLKEEIKEEESAEGDTLTPSDEVVEEQSEQPENEEQITVQEDDVNPEPVVEDTPEEPQPRMFSQDELNEIVGNTRQEARDRFQKGLYERYGVENDDELNEVFGRGQAYSVLNDNFNDQGNQLKMVMAENALLKSKIAEDRWDDVKLILGGKGMDVSVENIATELATHPEWMGSAPNTNPVDGVSQPLDEATAERIVNTPKQEPVQENSVIRKFGSDIPRQEEPTDDEMVNKLFGL